MDRPLQKKTKERAKISVAVCIMYIVIDFVCVPVLGRRNESQDISGFRNHVFKAGTRN